MEADPKMRTFAVKKLTLLLLATFATTAVAQQTRTKDEEERDKAEKMETITVTTGVRSPKAVDKISGAVTIITKEELAHTLAITEDATAVLARTVPGYAESSQAMSNTGETLRGRTALRLFDGIPQTSPLREGNRSGTFTDMGLIGRIEVINGPSPSEGIGASGGIINYISKTPTKPGTEVTVTSRYTTQFHDDSARWKFGVDVARKEEMYDLLIAASFIERGMTYGADRQDPVIAPPGTLIDQSEIDSQKGGVRRAFPRPDFLTRGLELRAGLDLVEDESQQQLALTGRLWVPPMLYRSKAPWMQLSYDVGPLTVSGGFRREDGELTVDSYTTTYFRNRVFVQGGKLDYVANLPNYGVVWHLPQNLSVFAAYGKGFSLPNVGIPLRNVNYPGQSVAGIPDLHAAIVGNKDGRF